MLDMSARVAIRQTPVLIIGETGTGKDLLARAIHENSRGRDGSFTKTTCALLRSDWARDTFQSTSTGPPGTLYLDDVSELPVQLQVELTQLLHESESGGDRRRTAVRV